MRLKVLLATRILVDEEVTKVIAEAANGSFCLLPRHVDFVAALVPGILIYETNSGEKFAAVAQGILVKAGEEVLISTRNGIKGTDLGELAKTVDERFRTLDEREKSTRVALARLETNLVRRFIQLQH